jgi:transposase
MANAYPLELRERVVAAYEAGEAGYTLLARRFKVGEATVKRWVRQFHREGHLRPKKKGGGTPSIIDMTRLERVVTALGDATAGEVTAAYNRGLRGDARHHVSSIQRALHRAGYVVKKSVSVRSSSFGPTSSRSAKPS